MADELEGKNFVALVRLSTAEDGTLAVAGETCARVPVSALAWLLDSRLIRRIEPVIPTEAGQAPVETPALTESEAR